MITITVPADSLEVALHGMRKGETWKRADRALWFDAHTVCEVDAIDDATTYYPHPDGWHRVESSLVCPRCGAYMLDPEKVKERWYMGPCPGCGLDDTQDYETEAEARAAWGRIGGKR